MWSRCSRPARGRPTGRLHVDVPSRIARRLLAPALPGLMRRHPGLQLVLGSSDRAIDLVQEGVDCAVRVGTLHDSSLVVRPQGCIALINCASPAYLREHGLPEQPQDLLHGHWSVGYASPRTGRGTAVEWSGVSDVDGVVGADGPQTLAVPSRVVTNNAESYIACCRAGLGLSRSRAMTYSTCWIRASWWKCCQPTAQRPCPWRCCIRTAASARAGWRFSSTGSRR